jgi:hypothetical protein
MGTFNYSSPDNWINHFRFDMEPYYIWGNTAQCTESHITSDGKNVMKIMRMQLPYFLESIFQLSILKPFVIMGEFMQVAVFYFFKPVVWAILFTIYYIFTLVINIKVKDFKLISLIALTLLYLINLYGNISAYNLIDAVFGF